MRQITALVIGPASAVVLAGQAFALAAFLNGKVVADRVAMVAWSDAQVAVAELALGILATLVLMVAVFRRRRVP